MTGYVLNLLGGVGGGGVQYFVYMKNAALTAAGIQTKTICPRPRWLDPHSHESLVPFNYMSARRGTALLKIVLLALRDRRSIAVISSHIKKYLVYGWLASKLSRKRHVMYFHGLLYPATPSLKDRLLRPLLRRAVASAARVVFVSEFTKGGVLKQLGITDHPRMRVIHNGSSPVIIRPRFRQEGEPLQIVYAGELSDTKNFRMFLRVIQRVAAAVGEDAIKAHIYGEGPYKEMAADAAVRSSFIHYKGYESDKSKIFEGKHLHVLLCEVEGFGRVVTEAMSAGIPTLAFAKGALPEIITPEVDGLLVDDEDAAVATIIRCVSNPGDMLQLSFECYRTFTNRFSEQVWAKKMTTFYSELLEDRHLGLSECIAES